MKNEPLTRSLSEQLLNVRTAGEKSNVNLDLSVKFVPQLTFFCRAQVLQNVQTAKIILVVSFLSIGNGALKICQFFENPAP